MASSSENEDYDESLEDFSPRSRKKFVKFKKSSLSEEQKVKSDIQLILNKSFNSDAAVENFMKLYEEETGKNYRRRDKQTKESLKNVSRVMCNPLISSRLIRYTCIHSKSLVEPKELSEKQRKTFTNSLGCKGEILFTLSKEGDLYIISNVVEHDKHEIINKKCSKMLTQNRKLTLSQQTSVKENVVKQNKLALVTEIHSQGTQSILRDISNIKASVKKQRLGDCMASVLQIFQHYNATYDLKVNALNELDAIFFTLPEMSCIFQCWPEFCCIDFTYKLLKLNFPFGLVTVVDGNGSTEVVFVCIVESESKDNLSWFINAIESRFPEACTKIQSFMADKDATIRDVLKSKFSVPVYICSFHACDIFKKQIHSDRMKITKEQREESLKLIQKMMYASNEEQYKQLYQQLLDVAPEELKNYFNENWHSISKEWVRGFMTQCNYMNCTNNRHENVNGKIKVFCEQSNFLADFIKQFLDFIIDIHQNERNFKALLNFSKTTAYKLSPDLQLFYNYVTIYAFKFIEEQFQKMEYVQNYSFVDESVMIILSKSGLPKYAVTQSSCTCTPFKSMGLPCHHILKHRSLKCKSLFDEKIVLRRWTKQYFKKHRFFQAHDDHNEASTSKVVVGLAVSDECNTIDIHKTDAEHFDTESTSNIVLVNNQASTSISVNSMNADASSQNVPSHCMQVGSPVNVEVTENYVLNKDVEKSDETVNISKETKSSLPVEQKLRNVNVSDVVLVKRSNPLGRPKGRKLNAIGLPKEKLIKTTNVKNFVEQSQEEQAFTIFSWFVYAKALNKLKNGKGNINCSDIKIKKVPCWFYNDEVDVNFLKSYMELNAFEWITEQIKLYKDKVLWICNICKRDLHVSQRQDKEPSNAVICDSCLKWFHSECLSLTDPIDENTVYYCSVCLKK